MRYFVWSIVALGVVFAWDAKAQERGVGVSPAEIEVAEQAEWPYTTAVVITNLSSNVEHFAVAFEKERGVEIAASPGRFQLESGEQKRVLLTFENPGREVSGFVRIAALGEGESEGVPAGVGVKLPFSISGEQGSQEFLAGAAKTSSGFRWFPYVLGVVILLVTLILLWQIAGMVRLWIFNSGKQ